MPQFLTLILLLFIATPAHATALTWGDSILKPLTWAKNSTINVYIQADPKGEGRDALLKEGLERWTKALADRGITLKTNIGNPPADATNVVRYTFDGDGFEAGGRTLGPGDLDNGIGLAQSDGTEILGGEVHIRDSLGSGTDMDKDRLRNLGEHEFTHVLGLADDDNGSVTKHAQPKAPRDPNEQDLKELNSLYGTATTGGNGKPMGVVTPSAGTNSFTYTFNFDPANAISDPTDPEHVALINLGIDPSLVASIFLPAGWIAYVPGAFIDPHDPFFTEGYMVDGMGDLQPWDLLNPMSFIALRTSVAEALADGLAPDVDPGLTLVNSLFSITVYTKPNVSTGLIWIYAGGELQRVAGPVVPEPSSMLLFGLGFLALRRMKK